jgi:hypothetical protein
MALCVVENGTGQVTRVRGLPVTARPVAPLGWTPDTGGLLCAAVDGMFSLEMRSCSLAAESCQTSFLPGGIAVDAAHGGRGALLVDLRTLVVGTGPPLPSRRTIVLQLRLLSALT